MKYVIGKCSTGLLLLAALLFLSLLGTPAALAQGGTPAYVTDQRKVHSAGSWSGFFSLAITGAGGGKV